MSNRDNAKLKEYIDRAVNIMEARAEALSTYKDDAKDLRSEVKGKEDELGFSAKEVMRLATTRLNEDKLRTKSQQISDDLALVDFFRDFKISSSARTKKDKSLSPGGDVGATSAFTL